MEGPTGKKEEESKPIAVSIFDFDFGGHCPEAVLHQQVERFWATEKHGFVNTGECADSVEDREALKSLKRTTSLVNGKYEVGLLWKNENPHLPNNRALAWFLVLPMCVVLPMSMVLGTPNVRGPPDEHGPWYSQCAWSS